jgi:hypothetical protein
VARAARRVTCWRTGRQSRRFLVYGIESHRPYGILELSDRGSPLLLTLLWK